MARKESTSEGQIEKFQRSQIQGVACCEKGSVYAWIQNSLQQE